MTVDDSALQLRGANAARRVRARTVWSLALFAAAFPATLIGLQGDDSPAMRQGLRLLATLFWGSGALFGLAAAAGALRHWDVLGPGTRWLGVIPAFGVGLVALLAVILAIAAV